MTILSEIVEKEVARRCAEIARASHHEKEAEWDWDVPGNDKRAQFYKHHIVHAHRQSGHAIARAIEEEFGLVDAG